MTHKSGKETNMIQSEYNTICRHILSATMDQITTTNMKRYNIDKRTIKTNDVIYKSAVADKAPITLVYTPAGSGKSALIKDRVNAVRALGTPASKIMVLNMNIAKVKQMSQEMPDINIKTFSDFTHEIFNANMDGFETIDTTSIANLLKMTDPTPIKEQLINKISMINQQERAIMLTLFINKHLNDTLSILKEIKKADYMIESIICQNMMYQFENNPYDIETILINGINNMPIPILCSVIEYANKYNCNLFITGTDNTTIYEFNMAYGGSLDTISFYTKLNVNIIRLTNSIMSESIQDVCLMRTPKAKLKNIYAKSFRNAYEISMKQIAELALYFDDGNQYLSNILSAKQPVLILARSRADIADIKSAIEKIYRPKFPDMKVLDLTNIQAPSSTYGQTLVKYKDEFQKHHPDKITTRELGFDLYNILNSLIKNEKSTYKKSAYEKDLKNCVSFFENNMDVFGDMNKEWSLNEIIHAIIKIEARTIQKYMTDIENDTIFDFTNADIILSTIHSAVDMRMDNVILFIRNSNDQVDNALYKTALSRANKSEYIVFINNNTNMTIYQNYLEHYGW